MILGTMLSDDIVAALIQAGVLGPIVAWFMWRDGKERDRNEEREEKRDAKIDSMVEALNHLIRMTSIEVMSRPNIAERAKEDTRELLSAIEARRGK